MEIKISVIIPTFNPKDYLWDCLDSLERQTLSKDQFEVILVLNGEREPFETLISKKLSSYSFIHTLLYSATQGVSRARNLGLDMARGEYICFVDDDDWVSDNYLECLLGKASANGIVVSNVKDFDEESKMKSEAHFLSKAYKRYNLEKKKSLYANRSFFSTVCCKLLPVRCIDGHKFEENIIRGEDSIFMYGISWKIRHIELAEDNCVYFVRKRHDSAGRNYVALHTRIYEFLSQTFKYTVLFLKHPIKNDPIFYLSRIAGTFHNKFNSIYYCKKYDTSDIK